MGARVSDFFTMKPNLIINIFFLGGGGGGCLWGLK